MKFNDFSANLRFFNLTSVVNFITFYALLIVVHIAMSHSGEIYMYTRSPHFLVGAPQQPIHTNDKFYHPVHTSRFLWDSISK